MPKQKSKPKWTEQQLLDSLGMLMAPRPLGSRMGPPGQSKLHRVGQASRFAREGYPPEPIVQGDQPGYMEESMFSDWAVNRDFLLGPQASPITMEELTQFFAELNRRRLLGYD